MTMSFCLVTVLSQSYYLCPQSRLLQLESEPWALQLQSLHSAAPLGGHSTSLRKRSRAGLNRSRRVLPLCDDVFSRFQIWRRRMIGSANRSSLFQHLFASVLQSPCTKDVRRIFTSTRHRMPIPQKTVSGSPAYWARASSCETEPAEEPSSGDEPPACPWLAGLVPESSGSSSAPSSGESVAGTSEAESVDSVLPQWGKQPQEAGAEPPDAETRDAEGQPLSVAEMPEEEPPEDVVPPVLMLGERRRAQAVGRTPTDNGGCSSSNSTRSRSRTPPRCVPVGMQPEPTRPPWAADIRWWTEPCWNFLLPLRMKAPQFRRKIAMEMLCAGLLPEGESAEATHLEIQCFVNLSQLVSLNLCFSSPLW